MLWGMLVQIVVRATRQIVMLQELAFINRWIVPPGNCVTTIIIWAHTIMRPIGGILYNTVLTRRVVRKTSIFKTMQQPVCISILLTRRMMQPSGHILERHPVARTVIEIFGLCLGSGSVLHLVELRQHNLIYHHLIIWGSGLLVIRYGLATRSPITAK